MCAVVDHLDRSKCKKLGQITGYQTRYPERFNLDEGCFIKIDSRWITTSNWRAEK